MLCGSSKLWISRYTTSVEEFFHLCPGQTSVVCHVRTLTILLIDIWDCVCGNTERRWKIPEFFDLLVQSHLICGQTSYSALHDWTSTIYNWKNACLTTITCLTTIVSRLWSSTTRRALPSRSRWCHCYVSLAKNWSWRATWSLRECGAFSGRARFLGGACRLTLDWCYFERRCFSNVPLLSLWHNNIYPYVVSSHYTVWTKKTNSGFRVRNYSCFFMKRFLEFRSHL